MISRLWITKYAALALALSVLPAAAFAQELKCSQAPDLYDARTPYGRWRELPRETLSTGPGFTLGKAGDISAEVAIAWNASYFFVIAFVDDPIFCPSDRTASFWKGDSIQFGIKPVSGEAFFLGAADLPSGRCVIPTQVPDGYPSDIWNVPFEVI